MATPTITGNKIGDVLSQPEMRVFWILLPFLFAIFAINAAYLDAFWVVMVAGIEVIVALVVFFVSFRISALNREKKVGESEVRDIMLSLQDALIGFDGSYKISYFNAAAEKMFGLKPEAIIGRVLTPQAAQDPSLQRLAQVIFPSLAPVMVPLTGAGEYPQIVDLSFTEPELELRVTTSPVRDSTGQTIGFVKIVSDKTREVLLIKSKTEFIQVASHQLRTPMTEISWALDYISQSEKLDPEIRSVVEKTLAAAKTLVKITEDIISISKIEEGHFGYAFQDADINAFIESCIEQVLPVANQAGIRMYFDKPTDPMPLVSIDAQKLSIVLVNLLENAVRYNTANGEVTVRLQRLENEPYLKISVKDTGIGIPADQVKKLFTKFFRADNAVKFQTRGSGLGLYIARNIVRMHGGQMGAESELNRGSIFWFTLPTDKTLIPPHEIAGL